MVSSRETESLITGKSVFYMYIDSGATDHLVNDDQLFCMSKVLAEPIEISVAKNGETLKATKVGIIRGTSVVNEKTTDCILKEVLYLPKLRNNLLSVTRLSKSGIEIVFRGSNVEFVKNGMIFAKGIQQSNLYILKLEISEKIACNCQSVEGELWHKRLGHLGSSSFMKLKICILIDDVKCQLSLCESYIKGKQSKPFEIKKGGRSTRPIELVHSDVCGPISPVTHDGKRYYVCFTDDCTCFSMTYLMESKN